MKNAQFSTTARGAAAKFATLRAYAETIVVGLSHDTFVRLAKTDPAFPKAISLTAHKRLYVVAELNAYLAARANAEPLPPIRPAFDARKPSKEVRRAAR
jgi:predicted DNA-binding transcriptional regulator AlpA